MLIEEFMNAKSMFNKIKGTQMKPIKIRHICRLPILMWILMPLGLGIAIFFFVLGVQSDNTELGLLGGFLLLIFAIGMYFASTYGIKITKNKVVVRWFFESETFKYDNINYIKIGFDEDSVWGEIKVFREKPYEFLLDEFSLEYGLMSSLTKVKVKISKRKANKILKDLARCEKVRILHRFDK